MVQKLLLELLFFTTKTIKNIGFVLIKKLHRFEAQKRGCIKFYRTSSSEIANRYMWKSTYICINLKFFCLECNTTSNLLFEASRGAAVQACDCKHARLWVRFTLKEIKYLIFSFPRFGNKVKRDVDFRHLTCNASKISRKRRS